MTSRNVVSAHLLNFYPSVSLMSICHRVKSIPSFRSSYPPCAELLWQKWTLKYHNKELRVTWCVSRWGIWGLCSSPCICVNVRTTLKNIWNKGRIFHIYTYFIQCTKFLHHKPNDPTAWLHCRCPLHPMCPHHLPRKCRVASWLLCHAM
jgi:hypothetical protein